MAIWEELLNRIPVVRTVYGGVKSFAESVFSQSNSFRKVVMIEYPRAGMWSIGFMTAEDVPEISRRTGEPHACVYISNALNATGRLLVIVPRRQIVELDMTVDAAMKMIITCGVVVPQAAGSQSPGRTCRRASWPGSGAGELRGCGACGRSVVSRALCAHITADRSTRS